jgi:hypothetical protein
VGINRRSRRGQWTSYGFTAAAIGKLMGASTTEAKRVLYRIKEVFEFPTKKAVDIDLVGEAIQAIRNQRELKRINKKLNG